MEFPAVLRVGKKYYMLENVSRDGAYKKEGDLNNIIPSDSNIAYGNEANYVEVDLEGSSSQTSIGFMFGNRPTSNEIIQFGKDKRISFGDMAITEQDEQSGDDMEKFFGVQTEESNEMEGKFEDDSFSEYIDFEEINTEMKEKEDNLELSDEDMLTDFYKSLTVEQQTKLATNEDLGIFSAADVVSLLNKGKNTRATDVIELLKKCYI